MNHPFAIKEGKSYPLGATCVGDGVNFALFSANADKVELCLFDDAGEKEIARIALPGQTDQVWHVYVEGLKPGALYGYRVHGPYEPQRGHRFNPHKLLFDPYAKKIAGYFRWHDSMHGYKLENPDHDLVIDTTDNAAHMPKSVVLDTRAFADHNNRPAKPYIPWNKTIVYETHVKGFTQLNPAVPEHERGRFAGLAHPDVLDYIKDLGVTTIEILPAHGFVDEQFLLTQGLSNYWGYNTLHFFVPHANYLMAGEPEEFRRFVDAVHEHGLEVVMDVVYNHTAEGNHLGPTLSFRGIDNSSYYCLQAQDARFYVNDTGCGNTLNLKHPRVLQFVMDSLRYWYHDMGVDGFRFDLATVLGREAHGFDPGSGFFDAIRQDPVLAHCKLIAEPWDIGPGGYQVGNYPTGWAEWNDRYRDTCRRFWRGEPGRLPEFARRIHGSSDIFEHSRREPSSSVNFIASHDGFTLADLVSYKNRHNEANKENNNDGHHSNFSDNYGVEGPTKDEKVQAVRERQKRNFLATLFLSQGTPMLLAGDEISRTQNGNNNAYCQDNEINWLNWQNRDESQKALQCFAEFVISLRGKYSLLTSRRYIHRPDEPEGKIHSCVRWVHESGEEMEEEHWIDPNAHTVGWILESIPIDDTIDYTPERLLILFNSGSETVPFTLPKDPEVSQWNYLLDTYSIDGKPANTLAAPGAAVKLKDKSMIMLSASFK